MPCHAAISMPLLMPPLLMPPCAISLRCRFLRRQRVAIYRWLTPPRFAADAALLITRFFTFFFSAAFAPLAADTYAMRAKAHYLSALGIHIHRRSAARNRRCRDGIALPCHACHADEHMPLAMLMPCHADAVPLTPAAAMMIAAAALCRCRPVRWLRCLMLSPPLIFASAATMPLFMLMMLFC